MDLNLLLVGSHALLKQGSKACQSKNLQRPFSEGLTRSMSIETCLAASVKLLMYALGGRRCRDEEAQRTANRRQGDRDGPTFRHSCSHHSKVLQGSACRSL